MRGTLLFLFGRRRGGGIIPAYAGNTSSPQAATCRRRDHPRVCGEHAVDVAVVASVSGSSPRMRGTHIECSCLNGTVRIIPAYAGNTTLPAIPKCGRWDHPRVCGEHSCNGSRLLSILGSSPRMRGTRELTVSVGVDAGIIPAYAGNTTSSFTNTLLDGDHPRVCGEHHACHPNAVPDRGSSPRMRGTLRSFRCDS